MMRFSRRQENPGTTGCGHMEALIVHNLPVQLPVLEKLMKAEAQKENCVKNTVLPYPYYRVAGKITPLNSVSRENYTPRKRGVIFPAIPVLGQLTKFNFFCVAGKITPPQPIKCSVARGDGF